MIIALSGFMGSGKSHVAACLAKKMDCFFFDLDDTIQMGEGLSVSEIFSRQGEASFRLLEFEYLERIISDYGDFPGTVVIALGGGTVLTPQCADLLKKNATCIYLRASIEELVHNLEIVGYENRPLLAGAADLRQSVAGLMAQRDAIYEKTAAIIIDIDGLDFDSVADLVISRIC